MSKICVSCGKEIDESADICEYCDAAQVKAEIEDYPDTLEEDVAIDNDEEEKPESNEKKKKADKKPSKLSLSLYKTFGKIPKIFIPVAVLILAVIVIIIGISGSTYKSTLKKSYKYLCKNKADKYISTFSTLNYGGIDKDEFYKDRDYKQSVLNRYNDITGKIGKVKSVKIKITNSKKLKNDEIEGYYMLLVDNENAKLKLEDITKGRAVAFEVIIKGANGTLTYECTDFIMLKENGKWKILTLDYSTESEIME